MTHPRIEKTAFLALFLAAVPALAAQAPAWVESEVKAAESDLTALRHKLHAMPELGNQEVKTQAEIVRILKEAGIETVVVEPAMFPNDTSYDMAIRNKLKDMDIELVINAGFYPGVGRETARSFHNKVIAVQPSLIPAFETLRGDAVHEAVLARGLKVTGATAYLVDENGGVGPVLLQKAVPVLEDDDLTTLKRRVLTDAEWKLLPEAVKRFCAGKIRLHGGRAQLLE